MKNSYDFWERYKKQVADIYEEMDAILLSIALEKGLFSSTSYQGEELATKNHHIDDAMQQILTSTYHLGRSLRLYDIAKIQVRTRIAGILLKHDYTYREWEDGNVELDLAWSFVDEYFDSVNQWDIYLKYRISQDELPNLLRNQVSAMREFVVQVYEFAQVIEKEYTRPNHPYRQMNLSWFDGTWDFERIEAKAMHEKQLKLYLEKLKNLESSRQLWKALTSRNFLAFHRLFHLQSEIHPETFNGYVRSIPIMYDLYQAARGLLDLLRQIDIQIAQSMYPSDISSLYVKKYVYESWVLGICSQILMPTSPK